VVDLISSAAPLAADPAALSAAESRGKPAVAVPNPLPTELTSTDDVVGTGTEVKDGMKVVAHYVGVTADGQEFDSSWSRNEPVTFGLDEVIPGWTKGLPGMKVGGRRTLVIPADLAYGTDASSGRPTGTLIFVIDLVGAG
jgi:peptidylprolyl isomerase